MPMLVTKRDGFTNQWFRRTICSACISKWARLPVICDDYEQSLTCCIDDMFMNHHVYHTFGAILLLRGLRLPVFCDGFIMLLLVMKHDTYANQWFYHNLEHLHVQRGSVTCNLRWFQPVTNMLHGWHVHKPLRLPYVQHLSHVGSSSVTCILRWFCDAHAGHET